MKDVLFHFSKGHHWKPLHMMRWYTAAAQVPQRLLKQWDFQPSSNYKKVSLLQKTKNLLSVNAEHYLWKKKNISEQQCNIQVYIEVSSVWKTLLFRHDHTFCTPAHPPPRQLLKWQASVHKSEVPRVWWHHRALTNPCWPRCMHSEGSRLI